MKRLFLILALTASVASAQRSMTPSTMVSQPQLSVLEPTYPTVSSMFTYINDNWPTNINPDEVYPTYGEMTNAIGQAAMPGTNIVGATYHATNRTWVVDNANITQTNQYITVVSNAYTTLQMITNINITQAFTILTNGAPMAVDYICLVNTGGWYNFSDTATTSRYHLINTWTNVPEPGSGNGTNELGFDSTNGVVTIPADCLAISYFRGKLKDKVADTTYPTSLSFIYANSDSWSGPGEIFGFNMEESDDPTVGVGGDTRFFPPITSERKIRIFGKHNRNNTNVAPGATRDQAGQWQILLFRFLGSGEGAE